MSKRPYWIKSIGTPRLSGRVVLLFFLSLKVMQLLDISVVSLTTFLIECFVKGAVVSFSTSSATITITFPCMTGAVIRTAVSTSCLLQSSKSSITSLLSVSSLCIAVHASFTWASAKAWPVCPVCTAWNDYSCFVSVQLTRRLVLSVSASTLAFHCITWWETIILWVVSWRCRQSLFRRLGWDSSARLSTVYMQQNIKVFLELERKDAHSFSVPLPSLFSPIFLCSSCWSVYV